MNILILIELMILHLSGLIHSLFAYYYSWHEPLHGHFRFWLNKQNNGHDLEVFHAYKYKDRSLMTNDW